MSIEEKKGETLVENSDISEPLTENMQVVEEITTTFASHYTQEVSFEEMLQPESIQSYGKQATGTKFLVTPHK